MAVTEDSGSGSLQVEISGVDSAKGKVMLAVFRAADGFPASTEKAWRTLSLNPAPSGSTAITELTSVPSGTYAIAAFQDENGNGKLDRNFIGIPQEPWGVSNNIRLAMRAPKFDEARFDFNGKTGKVTITLRK